MILVTNVSNQYLSKKRKRNVNGTNKPAKWREYNQELIEKHNSYML